MRIFKGMVAATTVLAIPLLLSTVGAGKIGVDGYMLAAFIVIAFVIGVSVARRERSKRSATSA